MKFSLKRATIIARREYLTTVKRKAFIFTLLFMPGLFVLIMTLTTKVSLDELKKSESETKTIALVDSSGLLAAAANEIPPLPPDALQVPNAPLVPAGKNLHVARFASREEALDSLKAGRASEVVVVAENFATSGAARRYQYKSRLFTRSADDRALRNWMARALLAANVDSARIERTLQLGRPLDLYVPDNAGEYGLKDDARELISFFVPFVLSLLLSISIVYGGQYLLQGVSEEKETRILESLLCTVTTDDLMVGKLIGLGGAGLTLIGLWVSAALAVAGPHLALAHITIPMTLLSVGLAYFLLGYLYYASLMTSIGAITNNMREAQQFSVAFTMMNFFPFYLWSVIVNSPNSPLAVGLSMFPPTAATAMILRLSTASISNSVIPLWQVATSLGLLMVTAIVTLMIASRIFRLGLLLYGKTPNLPEIVRMLRRN